MKKILLTNFLLALGLMVMAQSQRVDLTKMQFTKTENAKMATQHAIDVPLADPPLVMPRPDYEAVQSREGEGYSIPLGSSYNIYSIIIEGPNSLSYHPDINSMIFSHRQNEGEDGGSGIISFDVSTDGGATWDASNKPLSLGLTSEDGTTINGNRYPNGSIYNPPGNTDPSNAYFVGTGAALHTDPIYGNGWGWEYVVSSKFDGTTDASEAYYTAADTNSYINTSMVYTPDGAQWSANYGRNQDLPHQVFNPLYATKLTFNEATKAFDRKATALPLNYENAIDSTAVDPLIAFSPDGMTGYSVIRGIDADDTEEYPSFKPIVWKTTDGGDTWQKQARIAYQSLDSLISYTIPVDLDGDGTSDSLGSGSPQIPFMSQYDIAVDGNGRLHIYASMVSSSNDAEDSEDFGFVWTGVGTLNFFHFINTGDGSDDWEAHFIDTWFNEDGAVGGIAVDERVQMGRSPEGDYVFFSHSESTYLGDEEAVPNDFPDIHAGAYRVSDGFVVDLKNLGVVPGFEFDDFEFLDAATTSYFQTMSPVTKEGGENWDHEIPFVYSIPRDLSDDVQPIDYFYYFGVGFDEDEFHERGVPAVLGTKTLSPEAQAVKVYPNPTTGEVALDLSAFKQTVQIQVMDMMGRTIQTLSQQSGQVVIDLASEMNGMYLIQVQTENEVFSKKVMKMK